MNHSIEAIMHEVREGREREAKRWYVESEVASMSLEEVDRLWRDMSAKLDEQPALSRATYSLEIELLAKRLDYLLNPSGKRMPSREEQTALDIMRFLHCG